MFKKQKANSRKRELSPLNAYHVAFRATRQEDIFDDDSVKAKFIACMLKALEKFGVRVTAWCVMTNHVHMLVEGERDGISLVFQSIGASFCKWFNWVNGLRGSLFENRHYAEPISDEMHYLATLAYIYNNPVKAGLCDSAEDYEWSSFQYLTCPNSDQVHQESLLSTYTAEEIAEITHDMAKKYLPQLELVPELKVSDRQLINFLKKQYAEFAPGYFARQSREFVQDMLEKVSGLNVNLTQVSRVVGIGVYRLVRLID